MWHIVQPVLVGVIGAEIDLKHFSVNRLVYYMATLSIGLTVKTSASSFSGRYITQKPNFLP